MNNDTRAPTPGQEGSDMACATLTLLHRHQHSGLPARDLQVLLGMDKATIDAVLTGLQHRGRIVCIGRGLAACWVVRQFAPQAQA